YQLRAGYGPGPNCGADDVGHALAARNHLAAVSARRVALLEYREAAARLYYLLRL
nr:hypothetical protein [Tanacetum cinerariifolium]